MKKTAIKKYINSVLFNGKVQRIGTNVKDLIIFDVLIDKSEMFFTEMFFAVQSVVYKGQTGKIKITCIIKGENLNYFKKLIENEKINK